MTERALTLSEVAERFGVSKRTVAAWISSGELRALNVGRKPGSRKPRWRIATEAINAFELRRQHSPPPPRARRRAAPEVVQFY